MKDISRRSFIGLLSAGALSSLASCKPSKRRSLFRIRTITAGVELGDAADFTFLQEARTFLDLAAGRFREASFHVQSTRIATQPLQYYLPSWMNQEAIKSIQALDQFVVEGGSPFSIGPVMTEDTATPDFASWAADLINATSRTSFSTFIASPQRGIHHHAIQAAAAAISAIAYRSQGAMGNFRFCATAFCPPGTPFFPAAYHEGPRAFSIGLESPRLVLAAIEGANTRDEAKQAIKSRLDEALTPVEALANIISKETGWAYLGIDTSPAPGMKSSIGGVIEALAGAPFGSPATLSACSTLTGVLKGLRVKTCGYSGLMLSVLEDQVLADRAKEGRYGINELLLYSTVCGTGLDMIPLAGDTPVADLAKTIEDVASLATRHQKALSARLFLIPGKTVGEDIVFDHPLLKPCKVMSLS